MAKRTQQEIDRQIEGLLKTKKALPSKSTFGDDNHGKIDAQISVLKGIKKAQRNLWTATMILF